VVESDRFHLAISGRLDGRQEPLLRELPKTGFRNQARDGGWSKAELSGCSSLLIPASRGGRPAVHIRRALAGNSRRLPCHKWLDNRLGFW
jgi:hypothetical protein